MPRLIAVRLLIGSLPLRAVVFLMHNEVVHGLALCQHGWERVCDSEFEACGFFDLVESNSRGDFKECGRHDCTTFGELEDTHLGNNHVHDAASGQWKTALLLQLVPASLR